MSRSQPGNGGPDLSAQIHTFDEVTIKHNLVVLTNRSAGERKTLRGASEDLHKKKAIAQLAITFNKPELLNNDEAKAYLQQSIEGNIKLHAPDKEAIIELEIDALKIAYDLAKFDCDTTDQEYDKWKTQLMFVQSEMKLR